MLNSKRVFIRASLPVFTAAMLPLPLLTATRTAFAHHGWSSFDDASPLYLEGTVKAVKWQNPHAELILDLAASAGSSSSGLPGNLATNLSARIPAQQANVDAAAIVSKTKTPNHRGAWEVELAPLARMNAWQMVAPTVGSKIAVIGYSFAEQKPDSKGMHILRAEFVFVGDKTYSIRSGPV